MIPAVAIACYLLNIVPVTGCDPAGQWYIQQAMQIPESHLRMVRSITLWDEPNGDAGWPSMTIRLPATNHWNPGVLSHEVSHIVSFTLKLNGPYEETFWPGGQIRGRTTEYGRTNHFEDIAECGSAIDIREPERCDPDRIQWLRERMFKGTGLGL